MVKKVDFFSNLLEAHAMPTIKLTSVKIIFVLFQELLRGQ